MNARKTPAWVWIVAAVVGAMLVCCLGSAAFNLTARRPAAIGTPPVPASGGTVPVAPVATVPAAAEPTPTAGTPITVQGAGNVVQPLDAPLTGTYQLTYQFGSWCGIVHFLKANGANGSGLMETVNDCSGQPDSALSGSTVVHLNQVAMVKVDNTRGEWTLTFTRIG